MYVATEHSKYASLRALPAKAISVSSEGFWSVRQNINRTVSLRHGYHQLEQAGNFHNLKLAAGLATGAYRGPLFMDSDLYKWLEAVACSLADQRNTEFERWVDECTDLLASAQMSDGYINSYFQAVEPNRRWADLDHGHEMYCAGHLIQAAVAYHRTTGKTNLLKVALRLADHIDQTFGPGKRVGVCGHPEIEMALVELYRETAEARYLDLADFLISQRGQGHMRGIGWYGPEYHQDHVPVRLATEVAGHAVRQLYLASGAADLYLETGDTALLEALLRLWHDMTDRKMHLIGGYGARVDGESFGDAYELPSDRCYCETCAAIAAMMWNWRMLLATGEVRFADSLERSLFNNLLSGVSLDGTRYFYANILQSRKDHGRREWYGCACCPPNVMRQIAAVGHYVATQDASGVQIHQYMPSQIQVDHPVAGPLLLSLRTDYPWEGTINITVLEAGGKPWKLSLRLPAWAAGASISVNEEELTAISLQPGTWAQVERVWKPGDQLVLRLSLLPRLTFPHPRIDAIRGSLAIERGPLVYCLEAIDQAEGTDLFDVWIDEHAPLRQTWRPDLLGGVVTLEAEGGMLDVNDWGDQLYRTLSDQAPFKGEHQIAPLKLTAVPYFAWANRGAGPMRVWIPRLTKDGRDASQIS